MALLIGGERQLAERGRLGLLLLVLLGSVVALVWCYGAPSIPSTPSLLFSRTQGDELDLFAAQLDLKLIAGPQA